MTDSTIIHEFKSQFSSITYKEHKKLEGIINKYMSLLEKREKFYSELPSISLKLKEKELLSKNLNSLCLEKPETIRKKNMVQYELIKYQQQESQLLQSSKQQGIVLNPIKASKYLITQELEN